MFFNEKSDHDVKLKLQSVMFISGVMSIIIQKNTLCASNIRVIYFVRTASIFCPKTFIFSGFYFFWGGGATISLPARSPMSLSNNKNYRLKCTFFYKQSIFDHRPKNCLRFSKKLP